MLMSIPQRIIFEIQSMIAYLWFLLSISGNSNEKLHCGIVISMIYYSPYRYWSWLFIVFLRHSIYSPTIHSKPIAYFTITKTKALIFNDGSHTHYCHAIWPNM